MSNQLPVIGLIAGGRQFPMLVAQGVKERGHRLVAVGFTGHSNMDVADVADVFEEMQLGKLGKLIKYFKKNNVERIIMAGTINKPKIMDVRFLDMRAAKLAFKIKGKGDSSILSLITDEFESEGMIVAPAHEVVPDLLTPEGTLTRRQPDEREWSDIRFGWDIAKKLGAMDIGQCVVVREGIVAAVEALEGTDATIKRGCELGGPECVVIKVFKPGQQKRIDLPAIGKDTVDAMIKRKATCLAVEAGKSLFFDREATIEAANKAGLTIVGISPDML